MRSGVWWAAMTDGSVVVTVLAERGRAWPSGVWERFGEQSGEGELGGLVEHQLRHGRSGIGPAGDGLGRQVQEGATCGGPLRVGSCVVSLFISHFSANFFSV